MIFFVAMPFITGLINLVMPLADRRARRVLSVLNSFSFWMTVAGAVLTMILAFHR